MTTCQLLNIDVPRATARAGRLWIEPGQTCALGRGVYLTLERIRDQSSGRVVHRMNVRGPDLRMQGLPVRAVLNLRESTGLRVVPRALDQHGRLFAEFARA